MVGAAIRSAARTPPATAGVMVADVVELCSTKGSSWTRADVLQAICDLAPPMSQLSAPEWAEALEQACDRVSQPRPARQSRAAAFVGWPVGVAGAERTAPHPHPRARPRGTHRLFAAEAHDTPPRPSRTVDCGGLDVLQADAAAAVAGQARVVLVVGPAGAGKTTALRHAVADLVLHGRPVFGVAPTAKAAKVLHGETAMPADTVAKLLHEWRSGAPHNAYRLPTGSTLAVDEAGMVGTGGLADLVDLAVSQRWRLVLVGDPRQVTLPADCARAQVRLGYAATGHGYEGDTVDVSLGLVTPAHETEA